jgi:hypothetical protein
MLDPDVACSSVAGRQASQARESPVSLVQPRCAHFPLDASIDIEAMALWRAAESCARQAAPNDATTKERHAMATPAIVDSTGRNKVMKVGDCGTSAQITTLSAHLRGMPTRAATTSASNAAVSLQ